ncbi:nucleotide pyrophosphohydrolase [Roseiconus lacunae]|uniref:Nucleotide pyrophosphohydrolase n=1 Tax=Roseiconus lacunae TaxID=2605694 RepID=A0ABT7PBS4_9BACT|nr:nucleotide pyrophosphohydrolase [Roseiconus lacunae]MCD0462099.1 nucleotide pyrophosphohydrolase [Roseiconus lacunae]MDM4013944.1 nucleotide pyrophosphohydrolase [Roseiconus lacunae]WRQ53240.1 nucleotide pyrophosphohydrolase [Stieleria sp. HD01]
MSDTPNHSDQTATVRHLRDVVERFVAERDWHSFHNPKNLTMSLAIETGELMEHFQWLTLEESAVVKDDPKRKHDVGEELADCLSYLLALANMMDIDVTTTLEAKMKRNAIKYPVP